MDKLNKCIYCGKLFVPYRKNCKPSGYCSRYCYVRGYYIKNKSIVNKRNRQWHSHNRHRMNQISRKSRQKRKIEILNHYGGACCSICGITDIEVLTIDHVNGGGTKERRKFKDGHATYRWIVNNNFPNGFRVLCRNCNWKEYLKSLRKK